MEVFKFLVPDGSRSFCVMCIAENEVGSLS